MDTINSRPVTVLYHKNCPDGYGSAYSAWKTFKADANYIGYNYGDDIDLGLINNKEVYALDIALPIEQLLIVEKNANKFIWIDHHKTSVEIVDKYFELTKDSIHDVRKNTNISTRWSGAYLSWHYFNPYQNVPSFIKAIDDYDRWIFDKGYSKSFNKYLYYDRPWSFQKWERYENPDEFKKCVEIGIILLNNHSIEVENLVNQATGFIDIDGYVAPVANVNKAYTSDVGNKLAYKSGSFGVCYFITGDRVEVSLRSVGDFDVSLIAKKHGGGGHRNAAGFVCNREKLMSFLKEH